MVNLELLVMDIIFISIGGGQFSLDMVHSESIATKIGEIKKFIGGAIPFSKLPPRLKVTPSTAIFVTNRARELKK